VVASGTGVAEAVGMHPGYSRTMMQPAMIPQSYLEQRRRLGHDRFDEVWDGVLHMVPEPTTYHQALELRLANAFQAIAKKRGLFVLVEIGLFNPLVVENKDYRKPDLTVFRRDVSTRRGIEGAAELVIEIRSPDDESYAKLAFYEQVGVREVWIIDPERRAIEVYAGTNQIQPVRGVIGAGSLGLELEVLGTILKIKDGADLYEVDISDAL
jgi:Uma2 family endonuclease